MNGRYPGIGRAGLLLPVIAIAVLAGLAQGRSLPADADSIRTAFGIPEMGYVVASADSILAVLTLGFKRADTLLPAEPGDRFHLGSCTKAITGFIAGLMVSRGQIGWDTRFFALCPELEQGNDPAYRDITLVDLLSHRAWLQPLTEDDEFPARDRFTGSVADQPDNLFKQSQNVPLTATRKCPLTAEAPVSS